MFSVGDRKRDEGLTTPQDIERWDHISYGPDDEWNRLDVYRPKNRTGKIPVIVSVHGGGWVYGDKEAYQWYCMNLAQRGFAVVNFTYRLAPKHIFPAQMEDTNRVFHWVLTHAEEYGFDREEIYAVGDSAGGHILALYTCICTDSEYASVYEFQAPKGFVPKALGLNCGVYDIHKAISDNALGMMKNLIRDGLGKDYRRIAEQANVISHVNKDFPPTFIMTSTGDFLFAQAAILAERLEKLGVSYEYKVYGTQRNKLPHVFHCNIKVEEARLCNDEETAFFLKTVE
jgi:acetyl esterase/lipase